MYVSLFVFTSQFQKELLEKEGEFFYKTYQYEVKGKSPSTNDMTINYKNINVFLQITKSKIIN